MLRCKKSIKDRNMNRTDVINIGKTCIYLDSQSFIFENKDYDSYDERGVQRVPVNSSGNEKTRILIAFALEIKGNHHSPTSQSHSGFYTTE